MIERIPFFKRHAPKSLVERLAVKVGYRCLMAVIILGWINYMNH